MWKHALLAPLVAGMQRKEKGFLFLDTHAGRGRYDLAETTRGLTLDRKPEYPEGIGRLWSDAALPEVLKKYVDSVREFQRVCGGGSDALRFYPGSPWLAHAWARAQDRVAACELHPEEFAQLQRTFSGQRRVSLHPLDGYTAIRAMLPPLEKRALVLIDPSFEDEDEFIRIAAALTELEKRMPAATVAIWYPISPRAGAGDFLIEIERAQRAPAFTAEVHIAGDESNLRLRGCGLLVINPPWQVEADLRPIVDVLPPKLSQGPWTRGVLRWLVREK